MSRWDSRIDPASARRGVRDVVTGVAGSCACVVKVLSALVK
jgi:hypothetical protein